MNHIPLRQRIGLILDYEPTWSPEFGSGLAIFLWSVACFATADYSIRGEAWIMPSFGLLFGPLRWVLLVRVWYGPRVLVAAVASIWWGWIISALYVHYGVVPAMGAVAGVLSMDLYTMARFSSPCLRDILRELRGNGE